MKIEIELNEGSLYHIIDSALDATSTGKRFYMEGKKALPCHVTIDGQESANKATLIISCKIWAVPDGKSVASESAMPKLPNVPPNCLREFRHDDYDQTTVGICISVVIVAFIMLVFLYWLFI